MVVSEIRLYELLKAKIGNLEAEAFVEILEKKVDQKFDDAKQTLATKEDIANLKAEIANSKTDMVKWFIALFIPLALMVVGLYFKK